MQLPELLPGPEPAARPPTSPKLLSRNSNEAFGTPDSAGSRAGGFVADFAAASGAAVAGARAMQRAQRQLDVALVQAAIALSGFATWGAEEASPAHSGGPALQLARDLGANLAALQAECRETLPRLGELAAAQAEFSGQVERWLQLVPANEGSLAAQGGSSPGTQRPLTLASQFFTGGALRAVCERQPLAKLRGVACVGPEPPGSPHEAEQLSSPTTGGRGFRDWQPRSLASTSSRGTTPGSGWKGEESVTSPSTPTPPSIARRGPDWGAGTPRRRAATDNIKPSTPQAPGWAKVAAEALRRELPELQERSDRQVMELQGRLVETTRALESLQAHYDTAQAELAILRARAIYAAHRAGAGGAGGPLKPVRAKLAATKASGQASGEPEAEILATTALRGAFGIGGDRVADEAVKCWMLLQSSGLDVHARAEILAKTKGVLRIAVVSRELRSYQAKLKQSDGANQGARRGGGLAMSNVASPEERESQSSGEEEDGASSEALAASPLPSPRSGTGTVRRKRFASGDFARPDTGASDRAEVSTRRHSFKEQELRRKDRDPLQDTMLSYDAQRVEELEHEVEALQSTVQELTLKVQVLEEAAVATPLAGVRAPCADPGMVAGGPRFWGIKVGQLADFRDRIRQDMRDYCSEHQFCFIDDKPYHVCNQCPCTLDHGAATFLQPDQVPADAKLEPLKPNMHLVVSKYVRPETLPEGKSFALKVNPDGLEVSTFISHCWGEDFDDFVDTLLMALSREEAVFVCSFALYQNEDEAISAMLGVEVLDDTPFGVALHGSRRLVVVVDRDLEVPTRLWCNWEISRASEWNIDTFLWPSHVADLDELQHKVDVLKTEHSTATKPEDEKRIRKAIEEGIGFRGLDKMLRNFVGDRLRFYKAALGCVELQARAEFAEKYRALCEERDEALSKLDALRKAMAPESELREMQARLRHAEKQLTDLINRKREQNTAAHEEAERKAREMETRRNGLMERRFRSLSEGLQELGRHGEGQLKDGRLRMHDFLEFRTSLGEFVVQVDQLAEDYFRALPLEGDPAARQSQELALTECARSAFAAVGGIQLAEPRFAELNGVVRELRMARLKDRIRQDDGYEVLGVDGLCAAVRARRGKFEREVAALAEATGGAAVTAELKDRLRAGSKTISEHGNDVPCLTGILRASVAFPGFEELYTAAVTLIAQDMKASRRDFYIVDVQDRFQYERDSFTNDSIVMFVKVDGVVAKVSLVVHKLREALRPRKQACGLRKRAGEAILMAAARSELRVVEALLREEPSCLLWGNDKNGRGPLHYSCQLGAQHVVRVLLEAQADPWASDRSGILPCELALWGGHVDVAGIVLEAMDKRTPEEYDRPMRLARHLVPWLCDHLAHSTSALQDAATAAPARGPSPEAGERSAEEAEAAADAGAEEAAAAPLPPPPDHLVGTEAEAEAWQHVGRRVVRLVRANHAERPAQEFLTESAARGRTMRVAFLLWFGLDAKPELELQPSALDLAIEGGHVETAQLLSAQPNFQCARCNKATVHEHLRYAAQQEDAAYATAALAVRADPSATEALAPGRRTALMAFAAAGSLQMCERLVGYEGLVEKRDAFTCSASHYARAMRQEQVAEFLEGLEVQTECDKRNQDLVMEFSNSSWKMTLIAAIADGCCGPVWKVVERSRAVRPDDPALSLRTEPMKETPLHMSLSRACLKADPVGQVCRALLLLRADPTVADCVDESPLHRAATAGNMSLYAEVFAGIAIRLQGEALAQVFATTMKNQYGQVAANLAERSKLRGEMQKQGPANEGALLMVTGMELLLRAAFSAFRHAALEAQLDAWRVRKAKNLQDLLFDTTGGANSGSQAQKQGRGLRLRQLQQRFQESLVVEEESREEDSDSGPRAVEEPTTAKAPSKGKRVQSAGGASGRRSPHGNRTATEATAAARRGASSTGRRTMHQIRDALELPGEGPGAAEGGRARATASAASPSPTPGKRPAGRRPSGG